MHVLYINLKYHSSLMIYNEYFNDNDYNVVQRHFIIIRNFTEKDVNEKSRKHLE